MKVLLTTLNSRYVHSNLAIRYLRSYCQHLPVELELQEFNINQNLDYIFAEIYKCKADVIGFSCYIWNAIPILQLCNNLKKVRPDLQIVLGGPEVSYDPEAVLRAHPAVDFIVKGEGEETFSELLQLLIDNVQVGPIPGLVFRSGEEIFSGPERPLIADLDRIPSPFREGLEEFENKLVYYESSRGCPFNCQYCLSSTIKGVRTFSPGRVEEDLLRLIRAGVRKVKFVDRTFNFDSDHALRVIRFLLANRGETSFHFEITAHLITDEMLEILAEVPPGLFQFEIGVQTTHRPTLKRIKRVDDFTRLTEVVRKLSERGNIHLHLDLIAGLPEEDYLRFQQSFNDVFNLKPDNLQLGFLKLLKGSGIRENAEDYGYRYLDQPPYEILANDLISFDEILALKMIEDLLETFYNSHKFEFSVEYIIERFYRDNPFGFFKDLKNLWESKGYHQRPHKDAALYQFLLDFYVTYQHSELHIYKEYLKFDFLRNIRTSVLPEWLTAVDVPDYKERVYRFVNDPEAVTEYLPHLQDLEGRTILRRILIEPFAFDLFEHRRAGYRGKVEEEVTFVLFDYEDRDPIFERVKYNKITKDRI